ncbi:unnamed protein product [Mycena citricolor]|nr:unnamed protein product [Mycena citricolor]
MQFVLPELARSLSRSSDKAYKRAGVIFAVPSHSSIASSSTASANSVEAVTLTDGIRLTLSDQSLQAIVSATRIRLILALTQSPSSISEPVASQSTDSLHVRRLLSFVISSPPPASDEHIVRRRKMMKLANLLGGPVPTSLVFPPSDSTCRSRGRAGTTADRRSRRRSKSVPPAQQTVQLPGANRNLPLPALTVDLISRPRPLAALAPASSPPPVAFDRAKTLRHRSQSSSRIYNLRRRTRDFSIVHADY